jgi:hypothetical protein
MECKAAVAGEIKNNIIILIANYQTYLCLISNPERSVHYTITQLLISLLPEMFSEYLNMKVTTM